MSGVERAIVLRRFDGVNTLVDQAYLGPSYLAESQNWIPGDTFRLTKAPGTSPYPGGDIPGAMRVPALLRCYDASHRYLYAVMVPNAGGGDQLWVSVDDTPWTQVAMSAGGLLATFPQWGATYGMEQANGVLYAGNGIDPILAVPLGGTATALAAVLAFTDGSAAPTMVADPGAQILSGTYAYCWAIFDHVAKVWLERGSTHVVTKSAAGDQAISFPVGTGFVTNGGALSVRFRAHLFVAPINLPIEFAHDQTPQGLDGSTFTGPMVLRALVADGPQLPLAGPARTGLTFRWHKGRLFLRGDFANPTAVWATSTLVPGLEQDIFNAGLFFPVNARLPRPPEPVTALGVAAPGEQADPEAPLVVTTLSRTFLFSGDVLDDPSAEFRGVSRRAGCLSADAMVETPYGVFYPGLFSVYVVPAGGGLPLDVGWPIRSAIQAIPPGSRLKVIAIYHKGFYKLAIVPPGGSTATIQWWLDLRRGLTSVPSWWGPHPRVAPSAWCVAEADDAEADRAFHAVEGGGRIEVLHQLNSFTEDGGTRPLTSTVQTGDLDDGRPFERKIFTRIRATGFPGKSTTVSAALAIDGGSHQPLDPLEFKAPDGAKWNIAKWNTAKWTQRVRTEGETVTGSDRPRGISAAVQFTHSDRTSLSLRDLEVRYIPVPRDERALSDDGNS